MTLIAFTKVVQCKRGITYIAKIGKTIIDRSDRTAPTTFAPAIANIAPTNVNIPERMVDFCLDVAARGWNAANGWGEDEQPHLASISLAEGASA